MNESGHSVKKILRNNNFDLKQMLLFMMIWIYLSGTLKLKIGGGHGGHNGLRSIISHAGQSFIRLRVGIGHPGNKVDVTNWVLGKFKPTEKDSIIESFINLIILLSL